MNRKIVIIGIGEMGGVFARGFLRSGYPVYPVTRKINLSDAVTDMPDPTLVLVAVAEKDLAEVLKNIPKAWRRNLGLLQNELLPGDWKRHQIAAPTVISVWFEKKKGQDCKVLIPSPVYGPKAGIIADSLKSIDIPCRILPDEKELLFELVLKNVFILTLNIAGLESGGTVKTLWFKNNELARTVAHEIIDLQQWLAQVTLPRDRLIAGMVKAIEADLNHKCVGRTAPKRLERAVRLADEAGLKVPKIREIYGRHKKQIR
jgi:ketopantoate reductase